MHTYRDLEKAKTACDKYVTLRDVRKSGEKKYHVIRANQAMSPKLTALTDDHFILASDTYLQQLTEWREQHKKGAVAPLHSVPVLPWLP
jgi:hypothetical protein